MTSHDADILRRLRLDEERRGMTAPVEAGFASAPEAQDDER